MTSNGYSKIIDQCSLCIAGIKPANLFCTSVEHLFFFIKIKPLLNSNDIYFKVISVCKNKVQIIMYRKNMLIKLLNSTEYKSALEYFKYNTNKSLEDHIEKLSQKITLSKQKSSDYFPNEIGIFLGYPPEDVINFDMNGGKKYILCGYWKVYHNEEKALETFKLYDYFKYSMKKKLNSGVDILKILKLA